MKRTTTLFFMLILSAQIQAQLCIPNSSSLSFNGIDNYVDLLSDNNLSITGPITVEAWINSASWGVTSAQGSIVCKHGWSNAEQGYVLRAGGAGVLSFNIAGMDTNGVPTSWKEVLSPTNSLQLNTWYHVAGTFDGYNLHCYINGVSVGTTSFRGTIVASPDYSMKIGRIADNQFPERWWNGMIDEVRVWNRALTGSEILSNMYHHLDPTTVIGLVSYWRFNENSGTSVADLGTANNAGMLVNATWTTTVPFNNVPPVPTISFNGNDLVSSSAINNQWYFGPTMIGGANASTYTPSQTGTYTVVVSSIDGCTSTSTPFLLTTLGTGSIQKEHSFELWPNPANTIFNVQLPAGSGNFELSVYNLTGQKMMFRNIFADASRKTVIDSHTLSRGVYLVEVKNEQFRTIRKLIIE